MISTLISFDRSVRRLSSLALIGTAVLAACDDSETTGPKPAAIPTAASPIISVAKPGTLRIMIFDQNGTANVMIVGYRYEHKDPKYQPLPRQIVVRDGKGGST